MKKLFSFLLIISACLFFGNYSANAQAKTPKKHWSHKKKDAVIGAGAGAVTGGVVSKHHVKGAVIGSAVGAGAGYIIGKKKDKKTTKKQGEK